MLSFEGRQSEIVVDDVRIKLSLLLLLLFFFSSLCKFIAYRLERRPSYTKIIEEEVERRMKKKKKKNGRCAKYFGGKIIFANNYFTKMK